MDALAYAIETTPIIDHHAHNLLLHSSLISHDLLSITSEANGPALKDAKSTLAHIRAVKNLSAVLGCKPQWADVKLAIENERKQPDDAWARRCFNGIETVLIDDGLDPSNVHPYQWHDRLVKSKCKRILRVERVAEYLISHAMPDYRRSPPEARKLFPERIADKFSSVIAEALQSDEIAGFKSVICYRTGLAIPTCIHRFEESLIKILGDESIQAYKRLEDPTLNPFFVHLTARIIQSSETPKPFQFHTGLGDNDISLKLSNPSHLQPFIKMYENVPIVLLHASYPYTADAGYLASVYKHVYLDIGEVFPMVSQDGQEKVITDALALCPSEKLTWSTDGHWFPETYLLAVMQIREGLHSVLSDCVQREALTVAQAIKVVEDVLFHTSNNLYNLNLELRPLGQPTNLLGSGSSSVMDAKVLRNFIRKHPGLQYLRLQWLDYTSVSRLRILPMKQALKRAEEQKFLEISRAVFGLLQQDLITPGFKPVGIYSLRPDYKTLTLVARDNHATVQCQFREENGDEVALCPRTLLEKQLRRGQAHGMSFLVGFEVEIVFMRTENTPDGFKYGETALNQGGHAWSTARAMEDSATMDMVERILGRFERAGIELQQWHAESAPGQYEFIFAPQPPMEAVNALLVAREIISSVASDASVRATLYPKPYPDRGGSGAHVHISVQPAHHWEVFFGGILKHLRAITAFTYSKEASYERVLDGTWSGGTWVTWGTQNREAPVRRIESSHFEIKCMDGLANPYFALAAIIGTGVQSVIETTPPPPPPPMAGKTTATASASTSPPSPTASPKAASSTYSPSAKSSTSATATTFLPIHTKALPSSPSPSLTPSSDQSPTTPKPTPSLTPTPASKPTMPTSECLVDPATLTPAQRRDLGITQRLPRSLEESLEALKHDTWLVDTVLGGEFVDAYLRVKRAEAEVLMGMKSDEERRGWLIERY